MDFSRMMRQAQAGMGGGDRTVGQDTPQTDNAETVYISSLALLKVSSSGQIRRSSQALADVLRASV